MQRPDPPKNVRLTRNSDNQVVCTWQSSATSQKPWSNVACQIRSAFGGGSFGSYGGGGIQGGTATSYTFNNEPRANGIFQCQTWSNNAAGDSSHAASNVVYTTPNAPSVSVSRSGESGVITIDASKTFAYRVQIQRSIDNGAWEDVTEITLPSNRKTTYTDANRSGVVRWRVRCVRPVYGDDMNNTVLYSSYATTASIAFSYYPWSVHLSRYMSCDRDGGYVQRRSGSYIARQNDTTSGDTVFIRQNNTYIQSPKTGSE